METLKNPSLFWDIDTAKINPVTHAEFIIKRVLDKGDIGDFRWAVDCYGEEKIREIFQKNAGQLNSKSVNFWCFYFNIDKKICTLKQLIKKQSPFWQR